MRRRPHPEPEKDGAAIQEKLRIPPLPAHHLSRPRLIRLWKEACERPIVLVTAGAGYGKTSFLSERAREEHRSVLWFRVDEWDSDLGSFVEHLLRLLGSPASNEEPVEERRMLALVSTSLRSRGPTMLVLDDAHLLQGSPAVLRFLEGLIRYLPEKVTLVLSSREPLPVGGMRIRSQGRAWAVEARDLEFRLDELTTLFSLRFPGATLPPSPGRKILAATEGWAAGLEIFFQGLDSPAPAAIERVLDRLRSAGSGWFDYFAEEVVARLDEELRGFLHRSSVLPRLDAGMCNTVLRREDSGELLERLVRKNLFTLREADLEEGYRYHQLFRAFLKSRLARILKPGELAALQKRAAKALLAAGQEADAAALYAESGDRATSLKLIERHGEKLLGQGRYETLERVFAAVPATMLKESPRALFVRSRLLDNLGRWDEAAAAYRALLRSGPAPALRIELYSILGQLHCRRGEYTRALSLCRKAFAERVRMAPQSEGRLLAILGVSACELGRIEEGERYLNQAHALFTRRGEASGQAWVDFVLAANVHSSRGDFARGRDAALRALVKFRALGDPRRICQCLSVLASVTVMAGELVEARDQATEALRLAESLGLEQPEALSLLTLARAAFYDGDPSHARDLLERVIRIGDRIGEPDARILGRLLLAEVLLAMRNPCAARTLAEEALALARAVKDRLQEAQGQALLSLLPEGKRSNARVHRGACSGVALSLRRKAEREFRRLGASFDLHRLMLVRLADEDLEEGARKELTLELVAGARAAGHESIFLVVDPARALRVLAGALATGIETEFASLLLARMGERAVPALLPLSRHSEDAVRLQAVELLAQIGGPRARTTLARVAGGDAALPSVRRAEEERTRAPLEPLGITALGLFRIRVGEQDVPENRWRSGRARRLFQLLLVNRFRWMAGDTVIESLWPETDPERARGNLWQSVYHLRKTLEPGLKELRASRYIRVHEGRYRLEPGEGYSFDVTEFEGSIRKAERLSAGGRARAAEPLYTRALDLYQGEFLAESPYEEFAASERERLRDLLIRATAHLAEFYSSTRRFAECIPICRRALREDPFNEDLHYHLIRSQAMLGHRREALVGYQEFEERISKELGLAPSGKLQALLELIRGVKKERG